MELRKTVRNPGMWGGVLIDQLLFVSGRLLSQDTIPWSFQLVCRQSGPQDLDRPPHVDGGAVSQAQAGVHKRAGHHHATPAPAPTPTDKCSPSAMARQGSLISLRKIVFVGNPMVKDGVGRAPQLKCWNFRDDRVRRGLR